MAFLPPLDALIGRPEYVRTHLCVDQGGVLPDVIDFLEKMGGDAQLSQLSAEELAAALSEAGIAPELRSAVLANDAQRLGVLLGAEVRCLLVAPPTPPGPPWHCPPPSPEPPPPPEEADEGEDPPDCFDDEGDNQSPAHRREPSSA